MLGVVTAVSGCGDDDDDGVTADAAPVTDAAPSDAAPAADAMNANLPEDLPDNLPTGPISVKVATYNISQTELIKDAVERQPHIIDLIKDLGNNQDVEVLCLQEVFLQYTSPPAFAAEIADVFPHAFWTWTGETAFGNGLLLVSKHPLFRGRELWWQGDGGGAVDRMALIADVVTDDSYFHVGCTHMEAFSIEVTNSEIDSLDQFIDDLGYQADPTIFLGDFNTGPATGCCLDQDPDPAACVDIPNCGGGDCTECTMNHSQAPYDNLTTDFFTDATDGLPEANECTFCREFTLPMQLLPPQTLAPDVRIDHCMYRNLGTTAVQDVAIFGDQLVTYDVDGTATTTQPSDHRGVACTFAPPSSAR